jgi:hypothetical protein
MLLATAVDPLNIVPRPIAEVEPSLVFLVDDIGQELRFFIVLLFRELAPAYSSKG